VPTLRSDSNQQQGQISPNWAYHCLDFYFVM
jgi:hypothetical protein